MESYYRSRMATKSFWDHPIEKLEEALQLKKQIHALQTKLGNMFGSQDDDSGSAKPSAARAVAGRRSTSGAARARRGPAAKSRTPVAPTTVKGGISAEGRERIAAAQRARWAKAKGRSVAQAKAGQSKTTSKAAKAGGAGKRTVSPEVRARLAAAMKARWATAKKKGLPGPNARR